MKFFHLDKIYLATFFAVFFAGFFLVALVLFALSKEACKASIKFVTLSGAVFSGVVAVTVSPDFFSSINSNKAVLSSSVYLSVLKVVFYCLFCNLTVSCSFLFLPFA